MIGKMTVDAELLGTDLKVKEGQYVQVDEATNQPSRIDGKRQYFVQPIKEEGSDYNDPSLLVTEDDFIILESADYRIYFCHLCDKVEIAVNETESNIIEEAWAPSCWHYAKQKDVGPICPDCIKKCRWDSENKDYICNE